RITELKAGELTTYSVAPEDLGLRRATLGEIQGGDANQNSRIILEVLRGVRGPRRDIVLMNAAAALVASGRASDLRGGVIAAAASIDSGKALHKLEKLIEFTNQEIENSK
ncbi:MAG TPA: anthranilate phosphoribosyltransferase, partial [Blastocatellia bacterium]|nr:anthranilate phosphoribosyltransferase [Blastocatellia bacterium]